MTSRSIYSDSPSDRRPACRNRDRRALPAGADAVVMVEETASEESGFHSHRTAPGRNVRRRGDIRTGDLVVKAGDVLAPSRIGALAAISQAEVRF